MNRQMVLIACIGWTLVIGCGPSSGSKPNPSGSNVKSKAAVEVCLVSEVRTPNARPGTEPGSGLPIWLESPPLVAAEDVASFSAVSSPNQDGGAKQGLKVNLSSEASSKLAGAALNVSGKMVAFVVNGKVISIQTLSEPLGPSFVISGSEEFEKQIVAITQPQP